MKKEMIEKAEYTKVLKANTQLQAMVAMLSGEIGNMKKYTENKWKNHSAKLLKFQEASFAIAQVSIDKGALSEESEEIKQLSKLGFNFIS